VTTSIAPSTFVRRAAVALTACVGLAALLAACGGDGDAVETALAQSRSPATSTPAATAVRDEPALQAAAPPVATDDAAWRPSTIAWAPCPEFASLECGTFDVPADYARPQGARFSIAVVRARATDPARRIGVLVTNPGGPGGSGVDFIIGGVAAQAPIVARLRERFDVIGFDPRGVKRSDAVRCDFDRPQPPADADNAALAAFFDDLGKRFAASCVQGSGERVFTLGPANVARDIDVLRRALGESTINWAGLSYGTLLGAYYASMYPQRLRATLLDAGVAPQVDGDALLDFWTEHTASFDFAFRRLDLVCRRDAACPLREAGVVAVYDELFARLKAQPQRMGDATLSHLDISVAVGAALYVEAAWPAIVFALHAARGADYAPLLQLTQTFGDSRPPGSVSALMPKMCGIYGARLPGSALLEVDATFTAAYPRFLGRAGSAAPVTQSFQVAYATALCNAWPAAEPSPIRDLRRRLAHPPLVIAGDFDNATPPAWSRRLADKLGWPTAVLRYEGGGHGVATSGMPCTDDAIVDYLAELKLPAPGASCPAAKLDFSSAQKAAANAKAAAALKPQPLR
jgi:pimeloyl-ACP methyl ester carboxylesterase